MTARAPIASFLQWFRTEELASQPWLILGKGPSYGELGQHDVAGFKTLSLNHVVRDRKVDVAHIVDMDVVDACGERIIENAGVLVMPWHPHAHDEKFVKISPASSKTLEHFSEQHPVLRAMRDAGRLLTYNLVTGQVFRNNYPEPTVVPLYFFGFEGAFHLLAFGGVKKIRSLGVDGGTDYSDRFSDLREKTLLVNGVDSFDRQFDPIAQTIFRLGIDFCPLNDEAPMRVFVAASESEMLAVKVLEFSIRRHASRNVEVTAIPDAGIAIPQSEKAAALAATPFSFQRFLIPEICNYQGRAVYMDSDMVVYKDLRRLWNVPMDGQQILTVAHEELGHRKPQFSVMLLDCAALDWRIENIIKSLEDGVFTYAELMADMVLAPRVKEGLAPHWNHLERYAPKVTGLLHYTDMHTQPWVSIKNRLGYLWVRELFAAVDHGFVSRDYLANQVARGFVRPSLLWQLDQRLENPLLIPRSRLALDKNFTPPYCQLEAHRGAPHNYRRSRRDEINSVKARFEETRLALKGMAKTLLRRPPPSPFH